MKPDQAYFDYSLLDFGDGRRLERFGELVLDRPCPSVVGKRKKTPAHWATADAIFVESPRQANRPESNRRGTWRVLTPAGKTVLDHWECRFEPFFRFRLKGTLFGHIGVFPEQAANWQYLLQHTGPVRVLNLFAYTGGSTLAAAAAGAQVTHVDAAKSAVQWARLNAELSGMTDCPIRWIVDDVRKFVGRELKRKCRYDWIILDPPSYGHGTGAETWQLARDLTPLLQDCRSLLTQNGQVLLTCHSPGYDEKKLVKLLADIGKRGHTFPMQIASESGAALPSGVGALATI